jgi:hypothetical protein
MSLRSCDALLIARARHGCFVSETSRCRKTPFIDIWPNLVKAFLKCDLVFSWRGRGYSKAAATYTRGPKLARRQECVPAIGNSRKKLASSRIRISTWRYGRGKGVGRGLGVGVALGVAVGVAVGVGVGVAVGVAVGVTVAVGVGVDVAVGVTVGVGVAVAVGVTVAVAVGVTVGVGVGVSVGVGVGV